MKKWYAKSKRPGSKQVEVKEHLCAVGELSKEYGTINEQIPKGNQKDRDISSLWW